MDCQSYHICSIFTRLLLVIVPACETIFVSSLAQNFIIYLYIVGYVFYQFLSVFGFCLTSHFTLVTEPWVNDGT